MNLRTLVVPAAAAAILLTGCSEAATVATPLTGVPSTSVVPAAPATNSNAGADEAAILQAGRARTQALIAADTDRLGELLADDFIAVHITGVEQSKAAWLEQIRAGEMTYHDVREQSASVTVDGDSAVLTSRNLVTATINGSRGTWPLASTTTYARIGGTWLATRSQSTTY